MDWLVWFRRVFWALGRPTHGILPFFTVLAGVPYFVLLFSSQWKKHLFLLSARFSVSARGDKDSNFLHKAFNDVNIIELNKKKHKNDLHFKKKSQWRQIVTAIRPLKYSYSEFPGLTRWLLFQENNHLNTFHSNLCKLAL